MSNDSTRRVAFDFFCDDVTNLMRSQGQTGFVDRDPEWSNPTFEAFVQAQTPQEYVLTHFNPPAGDGWF